MRFIDRIVSGLFNPSQINNYREDKKSFTFLYFIFLLLLYILPSAILIVSNYGLDFKKESNIKNSFENSEVIPYYIESNVLKYNQSISNLDKEYYKIDIDNLIIIFSSKDITELEFNFYDKNAKESGIYIDMEKTPIVFSSDGVYLVSPVGASNMMTYNEYNFEGLDFSLAHTNDKAFWNQAFSVINLIMDDYKSLYIFTSYFALIINGMMSIGLFSVCITFFLRMSINNRISFSKHWQMMIYTMTPYVLGSVLASLFGILIIYYIGVFLTIVNSFRMGQLPKQGGSNNEF